MRSEPPCWSCKILVTSKPRKHVYMLIFLVGEDDEEDDEEEDEEQSVTGGLQAGKLFVVAPPNGPTVTDTPEDEAENPVGNVSILRNHRLPSLGWPRFVNVAVIVDVEGVNF